MRLFLSRFFRTAGAPDALRDGTPVKRDPAHGFPFSMKDLALPDHLPALRAAGVSCFKVEGRKKSPLYVATTTDYYRKLLDGRLEAGERKAQEADLQTVFSRPWTRLFVQSHKDKEVADRDTVGHRGALIGHVESVRAARPHSLPHGPRPRTPRWLANRPAGPRQAVRLPRRSSVDRGDEAQGAAGEVYRGRRRVGGGGRFAARPPAAAARRAGLLLVVAGGETPLSPRSPQTRSVSSAKGR